MLGGGSLLLGVTGEERGQPAPSPPARGWGSAVISPSGVRGGALAARRFSRPLLELVGSQVRGREYEPLDPPSPKSACVTDSHSATSSRRVLF